jgi:DNA-binding transcriptional regulator YbjK
MSIIKEKNTVKRRTKGEQTRNKILKSAIEVLAAHGIKGTTHRAIANHANLQLSLTTYYFKDIKELVQQAFMLSSNIAVANSGAAWFPLFEYLDSFDTKQLTQAPIREKLRAELAHLITQYLVDKITLQRTELAIEQLLFTEIRITPQLRELADNHRLALLMPCIKLASYFNEDKNDLDGGILLTTLTQLKYSNLMIPPKKLNKNYIEEVISHALSWVIHTR